MIAETAYQVYKAITSPTEQQRFLAMVERDRKAAEKPAKQKNIVDDQQREFIRQQVRQLMTDRRTRYHAKRTKI